MGSNQDSPDPESGVLPITPRGNDQNSSETPSCEQQPRRTSGAEGARTPGLLGAIQALSQLSYSPVRAET